jgi:hypothetical protein
MSNCDADGGGNFIHLIWTIVTRISFDDLVMHSLRMRFLQSKQLVNSEGNVGLSIKKAFLNRGNYTL